MQTDSISSRNTGGLIVVMIACATVMTGVSNVGEDTWIAFILGGLAFLPFVFVYARIAKLYPGKGLYEIIKIVLGNFGGSIVSFLMAGYALIVAALTLRNFVEFTVVIALQDTPRIVLMIAIGAVALCLAAKDTQVLGRWSIIIAVVVLANVLLTTLIAFKAIDFDNLLPILSHSPGQIAYNGWIMGAIAVGETVLVLSCMGKLRRKNSPYKAYIWGVIFGVFLGGIVLIRNLMILGADMEEATKFSSYTAVRVIELGSFFERIESIISFNLILMALTKVALALSAAARGAAKLVNVKNRRYLLTPVFLLTIALCSILFKNMPEMFDFAIIYPIFAFPFQILIPVLVWILAEIKVRKGKKEKKSESKSARRVVFLK